MRYVDPETGLPLEAAEKIKPRIRKLEEKTGVISLSDTGASIGTAEAPASDIVTLNVTIISSKEAKTEIRELTPEELDMKLPTPKVYKLEDGRKLIGFVEDELPVALRKPCGYSLNEVVAILSYKVINLERRLAALEEGDGRKNNNDGSTLF